MTRIFDWNHISKELSDDEITELQALYKHYHKLIIQMLSMEIQKIKTNKIIT